MALRLRLLPSECDLMVRSGMEHAYNVLLYRQIQISWQKGELSKIKSAQPKINQKKCFSRLIIAFALTGKSSRHHLTGSYLTRSMFFSALYNLIPFHNFTTEKMKKKLKKLPTLTFITSLLYLWP